MSRSNRKIPAWLEPQPKRPAHVVIRELRLYARDIEATDPDFARQLRQRADELLARSDQAGEPQPTNGGH